MKIKVGFSGQKILMKWIKPEEFENPTKMTKHEHQTSLKPEEFLNHTGMTEHL